MPTGHIFLVIPVMKQGRPRLGSAGPPKTKVTEAAAAAAASALKRVVLSTAIMVSRSFL